MFKHPRFTPDGLRIISIFESPRYPPDIWSLSLDDEVFCQMSRSLPVEFNPELFVMPQEIRYPCPDPQFETVPALLFLPKGRPPYPTVVLIHGGPTWLYQFTWMPLAQHLISRGWAVLAPNYRGSSGYGKVWQLANRYELGGVDTRDVVAGADFLVKTGIADPEKIVVTGRSHGGYLTMTCLTQYPERWAAGSAVVPFLNWFTSHENSRPDLQHWDIENMGDPEEKRELWYERSPAFFLDRIQAPVQLICGANDPRCPASEALDAYQKLKALGKSVELCFYPDEGHSFLKIENLIDSEIRRISFLAKYLE